MMLSVASGSEVILSAMSLAFAARSPHIGVQPDADGYQPGVCNIGPAEIARRRRSGHFGAIATVVLFVALVAIGAPHWLRFIVALPAAAAAAGYIQAQMRFCIAFGSLGVFNFGELGPREQVVDRDARARDRMRAVQLMAACAGVGVAVGIVAVLVPV